MIDSIRNAILLNKEVLVRVDLNVPFNKNNKISDASRIIAIKPTINLILKNGGRPILLSHFGRPKKPNDDFYSLKKILPTLSNILKTEILFCNSLDHASIKTFISNAPKKTVILLENTRFFDGEESNSPTLSKSFSKFGDLYCNDAFSASHRSHASTVGIPNRLPSFSGLLLEKEVSTLTQALLKPTKPLTAIVGGSKVSTKIKLLENLIQKVDHIIIGGGMANTFLYAQSKEIGRSLCEKDFFNLSNEILNRAKKFNCQIHLPLDAMCAPELQEDQQVTIHDISSCPPEKMILDSGPKTVANIHKILTNTKTLIWNGPLGAFEIPPFNTATEKVAKIVSDLTKANRLSSIAGGGDTVAALNNALLSDSFSYVSNAGGAFLEWMEGNKLPGLLALENNKQLNKRF